jgi:hypothetical protein
LAKQTKTHHFMGKKLNILSFFFIFGCFSLILVATFLGGPWTSPLNSFCANFGLLMCLFSGHQRKTKKIENINLYNYHFGQENGGLQQIYGKIGNIIKWQ